GECPVLGGHEWLALNPTLTPEGLDAAWFTKGPKKVRSGFYTVPFESQGRPCLLVNGFYPNQAHHFTAPGQRVVLMMLHSDLPWRVLRREMLGDTYPDKAQPGSIRRNLLAQKDALGLARVDITSNFVHLSAGPFEGAGELVNFFRGLQSASFRLEDSRMETFWKEAGLEPARLLPLLEGEPWMPRGATQDLFGATEELDARSAAFYVAQREKPIGERRD
ncbi:MAG: nucleoside-diphosphate kinase, partial [Holophaga sp.]|nr:nucleoside-diphosphate kinase [Holophaga sp.]